MGAAGAQGSSELMMPPSLTTDQRGCQFPPATRQPPSRRAASSATSAVHSTA